MSTRVMVPKPKHDTMVDRLANFVGTLVKVGDPADPSVMPGPVIREERRSKIERAFALPTSQRMGSAGPSTLPILRSDWRPPNGFEPGR